VIWIFVLIAAPRSVNRYRRKKSKISGDYQWPKIDLPLIVIAALTIYMAIRSRRFIPIAAIAACPILAMFIDQTVRAVSATLNFRITNRLTVLAMPPELKIFFTITGIAAVLSFGTWCGLKFKRVYLDPWPADPKLNSIFMRMTASDVKPFYAMKFIKDNKFKGKMLNHWTEGGFIAFGQEPDPNTGRTPLQLFMDGRAQAAYNREAFDLWSYVTSGGELTYQIIQRTETRGDDITSADYTKIGEWLSEQLKGYNVWTVLMPASVYNDPERKYAYHAMKGLEHNPDWPLVFFNNKQKLFVDVRTPRGRELFDGIFNGQTIYPDEYHRDLIRAHSWLLYRRGIAEKKKGLDFAIKAFNANPSPTPMLEILLIAARFTELRPEINKFCEDYVKRVESEGDLAKQDGSRLKAGAARLAYMHLRNTAQAQNNAKLADYYTAQENKYSSELIRISLNKRW
jgi:hypothetical protein